MKTKFYLVLAFVLAIFTQSYSQSSFKFRAFEGMRSDFGLSYNFFVGPDSEDFRTTIRGFGSGFLLDFYSARTSWDMFTLGTHNAYLSVGAGLAISKYRFAENLVIGEEDGIVTWEIDPNPAHDYGDGFFSYGKSKLVSTTFIVPVNLNFDLGDFVIAAGGTYDLFLAGKLKRKFEVDGERQKIVTRNERFNDFPISRHKLGLSFMIMHQPSGLNIGATYMTTPYFKDNSGPEINEMRISVSYNLSRYDR